MKFVLLSALIISATLASALDVAPIHLPSSKEIGAALATSDNLLIREAGSNMVADEKMPNLQGICKSSSKTVGPCDVSFKVCPKLHHVVELRYVATACASGKCASSGETKSADGAAKDALYALMQQHPSCACGGASTTVGSCTFNINTCFQLNTDVTTPTFWASATCTKNAVSADYCCAATGEDAAKAAMAAVANKMNIAATCA